MKKCRHKKRIILATARGVEFIPDQEPFEDGIVESCGGIDAIIVDAVAIHYCPRCKMVLDASVDSYEEIWE